MLLFFLSLICLLSECTLAGALYGKKSSFVQVLDAQTFTKTVVQSNELWVVEFYADWCGHCQQFAPEYEKAASALAGIVNLAAVNDQSVMGLYGVQGFPTVKFFGEDKSKPVDYSGPREAKGLVKYALSHAKKIANDRLAEKSKPKKAKKDSGGKSKKADTQPEGNEDDVIALTGSNFDKLVMQDPKSVWFVEFYAPWCGHCKALAPHWTAAATKMKGRVKFGKVDATEEQSLAQRFGVQGFPTIKLFPGGKKSDGLAVDYQEQRETSSIVEFAEKYLSYAIEATQLLSQDDFEDNCNSRVCVIAILPHILDSGAQGRNAYIEEYNAAIKANPGIPVHYYWSQGGDQFEFEEALRLQFGYPALVAVHLSKGHYGVHRGGFDEANIREFVSGLMAGKVTLDPIPKNLPKLHTVTQWDGKDAQQEPEEDMVAT
ncbi:protein disulfide-isomerase A6 precursor, putative [Perkinsus marinus ATCC 50983]|uniref:protein disulfide-isomerase n=1 Tax=Perkinsus marinus (strain ATCC 50983 / TXsc) TaxID=423536 RepID=C5LLU1_PERM5|nr:protein disulfide-isomerase A6 precursor, putative [Perkinsus marinus ATCC 50983]EER02313.1 protein disulfide-isomerase A6 precursor, putative [Perkinsus marinus ATCC 50983]|eukprot:XP_002769595.1 protein disulfide-isomerase A6 precursor, putative [Perkinsus marinus ATCC 50983]